MLRDQELIFVANLAREHVYARDELLFEEGEVGDCLYVLTQGEVELTLGRHTLATLSAFQFFGEMGVLEKSSRSATVRARGEVKLLSLSAEDLTTFRGAYPDGYLFMTQNLARALSERLRATNARWVQAMERLTALLPPP